MRSAAAVVLLVVFSAGAGCDESILSVVQNLQEQAKRTDRGAFETRAGDVIDVETSFGGVTVTADGVEGGSFTADVVAGGRTKELAEKTVERYGVDITRDGTTVRIRLVGQPLKIEEDGSTQSYGASASFKISVPPGVALKASSGSGAVTARGAFLGVEAKSDFGAVTVEGARGKIQAKTSSGAVAVRGSGGGDVAAETSFGAVTVEHGEGNLKAHSSSGKVDVADWTGAVDARTDFGGVTCGGVFTKLRAVSSSGSVVVQARPGSAVKSPWEIKTDFGGVTLRVPEEFDAEVDAHTDFGSVHGDVAWREGGDERKKDHLHGVLGNGGGKITLKSGSGSITIGKVGG